jgi:hypothetical protein
MWQPWVWRWQPVVCNQAASEFAKKNRHPLRASSISLSIRQAMSFGDKLYSPCIQQLVWSQLSMWIILFEWSPLSLAVCLCYHALFTGGPQRATSIWLEAAHARRLCIGACVQPVDEPVDHHLLSLLFSLLHIRFCWVVLALSQTDMVYCTCSKTTSIVKHGE